MRRIAALVAILMAALATTAPIAAQTSAESVKASFLYRFTSFVTWPAGAFADAQTPIRLCVVGAEAFAHLLERVVVAQHVEGRAFDVHSLETVNAGSGCHVVFVVGDRVEDTLRTVRDLPVLTVTDGAQGRGDIRGMIHFVIIDDRVRFHIDEARAAESGFTLSSRLLSLAVSVRRRAGP